MLLNCGVGEDSRVGEDCKEIKSVLNIHWKDWCWSWNSNTLATSCEELTHWKRPWCWEGLGAGGEGNDRGWDGWMTSLTQWTRVGWTLGDGDGQRPDVLQFMGLQRVGHDWVTELNWTSYLMVRFFHSVKHDKRRIKPVLQPKENIRCC